MEEELKSLIELYGDEKGIYFEKISIVKDKQECVIIVLFFDDIAFD